MDEVKHKHTSFVITKHGKPVAKLVAIDDEEPINLFGALKGSIQIQGDIIHSTDESWDSEA